MIPRPAPECLLSILASVARRYRVSLAPNVRFGD